MKTAKRRHNRKHTRKMKRGGVLGFNFNKSNNNQVLPVKDFTDFTDDDKVSTDVLIKPTTQPDKKSSLFGMFFPGKKKKYEIKDRPSPNPVSSSPPDPVSSPSPDPVSSPSPNPVSSPSPNPVSSSPGNKDASEKWELNSIISDEEEYNEGGKTKRRRYKQKRTANKKSKSSRKSRK